MIKQILAALIITLVAATTTKAQFSIGATATYALATDDLGNAAKNGYGGTLHLRYNIGELIKVGIDAGYVMFSNKNTDSKVSPLIDGNTLSIIPVTAAFQFYFTEDKWRPFMALDAGWAYANLNLVTGGKNYVMVAPQFGCDYTMSEQVSLRLSVKDNLMIYDRLAGGSDIISYLGFNLGAMYKF